MSEIRVKDRRILQVWNSMFMFSMHSDLICLHYSINIIRSLVSCSTCPISTRGRTSVVWRPVVSAHYLQSLPLVVKMTCASAYACVCRRQTGLWRPANWAAWEQFSDRRRFQYSEYFLIDERVSAWEEVSLLMQRHRQRPYLQKERWLKAREQYSQCETGILKTGN